MPSTAQWMYVAVALCSFVAFAGFVTGFNTQCEANHLPCQDDNGECYANSSRCDGISDCFDGTDEEGCQTGYCSVNEFTCDNNNCIDKELKCNRNDDCGDGSDELECEETSSCEASEFKCVSNHQCINAIHRCDGQQQCEDNSDELNCPVSGSREPAITAGGRPTCASDQFDCKDDASECVPKTARCDKIFDCTNRADENENSCPVANEVVDEEDENVEEDGETGEVSAAHDCEDSMCSQICTDTEDGGYQCSCHEGYVLAKDSQSCSVAPASGVEVLWVTDGSKLYKHELYTGKYTFSDVGHQMNSVDVDIRSRKAFFIALDSIYEMTTNATGVTSFVESTPDLRPSSLAFDWVHKNLYWSAEGKIEVVSLPRKFRRNLIVAPDVSYAISMAVDPRTNQGYVYWGQGADERPGIYRAGLDGSNPERISTASDRVQRPSAITIDFIHGEGKLLWLDSYDASAIRMFDMATKQTSLVYAIGASDDSSNRRVSGLAFFLGQYFWADRASGHVHILSEEDLDSSDPPTTILNNLVVPKTVLMFNLVKQPSGVNKCGSNNGGCSHICLPTPGTASVQHQCFCPTDGATHSYRMNADRRTCSQHAPTTGSTGSHRGSTGKQNTKTINVGTDGNTRSVDGEITRDFGDGEDSGPASAGVTVGIGAGVVSLCLLVALLVACLITRARRQRKAKASIDAKSSAQMDNLLNGNSSSSTTSVRLNSMKHTDTLA